MSDLQKESKFEKAEAQIKNLTSGAIRLSIIILFSVVAWRIAWSNFSLDLSKFDFSDLLAMILALFAMSLAVAFYFKSTDSSNQFYDNIYNFTQKTSEILGRIEERFGEQLKHLDEGYGRLFNEVSKSPDEIKQEVKETVGKEEKEKEKLKDANKKMEQMLESLAVRAQMQEKEKESFYRDLEKLTKEKNIAQERIKEIEKDRDRMQQQLHIMEKSRRTNPIHCPPLIRKIVNHPIIRELLQHGAPRRLISKKMQRILEDISVEFIEELQNDGIINKDRELTTAGHGFFREILIQEREA